MRTTFLTLSTLLLAGMAFGQAIKKDIGSDTKTMVLPPLLTIKLTAKEFLRLDSAVKNTANQIDSKAYTNWFIGSFTPIYSVVEKQLVPEQTIKK